MLYLRFFTFKMAIKLNILKPVLAGMQMFRENKYFIIMRLYKQKL